MFPQSNPTIFIAQQYLDELLNFILAHKISDAHFEPLQHSLRIRLRLDGLLYEAASLTKPQGQSIVSRIKILAQLDIAEQRLPQDGRLHYEKFDHADFRISTCPVVFGEKLVIRNLKTMNNPLVIDELGMDTQQKNIFLQSIQQPQGLILVTGPTGSGKTVTLYSALQSLNRAEVNIISIEDPVEIKLPGINQMNIHNKIGLTFSSSLRSILRQDPDILMIGEMRDRETAEIAIAAAQTGHLVFSTLHTNSAIHALTRLQQMGIENDQLAHSILLIIAQRLIRKRCPYCTEGCSRCRLGYCGRTAVYELIPISEDIRHLILTNHLDQLTHHLQQHQWMSMHQHAREKIKRGLSSEAEVQRVFGRIEI
jgi:type II secretory ATPase GspE/PulE/Tfp pilus assembly ATPase PilB-like protein